MHGIKFGEPPAAKRPRFGIPGERAIAQGARQIYRFHAILFRPPSEFAAGGSRGHAPDDPEIASERTFTGGPPFSRNGKYVSVTFRIRIALSKFSSMLWRIVRIGTPAQHAPGRGRPSFSGVRDLRAASRSEERRVG